MKYYELDRWFEKEIEKLDISPTNYKKAVDRYNSVASMIEAKLREEYNINSHVYVQGSFMIGTVIKPYGKDKEYDVDLVCECDLTKENTSPEELKKIILNIIKSDGTYGKMLSSEEGRRTWTIEYAEDNQLSFHIDIQPSIPKLDSKFDKAIFTTTKSKKNPKNYKWDNGNPLGFKDWFDEINKNAYIEIADIQKRKLIDNGIYSQVDDIPKQLVVTKLQRLIQVLKRHRDIRFEDSEYKEDKPNSMIITILATQVFKDIDYRESLPQLVKIFCDKISTNIQLFNKIDGDVTGLLIDRVNGKYIINNPTVEENLAERWNDNDNNKMIAFTSWIEWVNKDFSILFRYENSSEYENKSFDTFVKECINTKAEKRDSDNSISKELLNTPKPWKNNV